MTNVRLQLEKREESLSFYATKSKNSKRDKSETPCPFRTEFQRDRDRILYSKAFRRLKHKTQVFIAPTGDHYATRLTHTLKVAQIARTIAKALNLNEDLVEAMSLGHDIGHTPFGHTGEDVLDKLYPDGFLHNLQSIRIVEILENDGAGLNLTQEVKDGILKHSVSREKITGMPNSLEGEICKIADKIAYITHDIDDAFRAGLIKEADLPKSSVQLLGSSYSERVNSFVVNVIQESQKSINKILDGISAPDNKKATISLTPAFLQEMKTLKFFLYERTYSSIASTEREKARTIIYSLYEYFSKNPSKIPEKFIKIAKNEKERAIVDYIAGMTDNYALNKHNEIKKTFSHS